MTTTDEQCEPKTPWTGITPEQLVAMLTAEFTAAFDKPEVQEKICGEVEKAVSAVIDESDREWKNSLGTALDPIIKKLKQQEQRIEKLEAALFRRAGL